MKHLIITAIALIVSVTAFGQNKFAKFERTIVDNKNHTVFTQTVFFAQDFENQPRYYLRTKLVLNGELVYIKDDDVTNNNDYSLPIRRKNEAFANMKKMLTINDVINHK